MFWGKNNNEKKEAGFRNATHSTAHPFSPHTTRPPPIMSAFSLSSSVAVASQRAVMRGSPQGASLRRAASVPTRSAKSKAVSINTVAEGEVFPHTKKRVYTTTEYRVRSHLLAPPIAVWRGDGRRRAFALREYPISTATRVIPRAHDARLCCRGYRDSHNPRLRRTPRFPLFFKNTISL